VAGAFSPDGKWLLTTFTRDNEGRDITLPSEWKRLMLWEVATGHLVKSFSQSYRGSSQHLLAFLPDGKHALSAAEGRWRIFSVPDGNVIHSGDTKPWRLIPWDLSRDGRRLLSSGLPSLMWEAQLWDVESREMLNTVETEPGIHGGWLSPDGKLALLEAGPATTKKRSGLMLWEFAQNKALRTWPNEREESWGAPAAFSPDGKYFVASQTDTFHLRIFLWDVATLKQVRQIGDTWNYPRWTKAAAFSADGKHLSVLTSNWKVPEENRLEGYSVSEGARLWSVSIPPNTHTAIFSANTDLALLAEGSMSAGRYYSRMRLTLWDTSRGMKLYDLRLLP
jgi:WD40 repeat protein